VKQVQRSTVLQAGESLTEQLGREPTLDEWAQAAELSDNAG